MKAAILGTTDYHATMREIATNTLQRKAGYVPPVMDNTHSNILPVDSIYLGQIDRMICALADDVMMVNCNPRSPFLILAWLLIGSDNPYRSCQYDTNSDIYKQAAILHIRTAIGDTPKTNELEKYAESIRQIPKQDWAMRTVAWVISALQHEDCAESAQMAIESAIWATHNSTDARAVMYSHAQQWAHISDEEALQIARQLTLDIMELT